MVARPTATRVLFAAAESARNGRTGAVALVVVRDVATSTMMIAAVFRWVASHSEGPMSGPGILPLLPWPMA